MQKKTVNILNSYCQCIIQITKWTKDGQEEFSKGAETKPLSELQKSGVLSQEQNSLFEAELE